MVILWLSCSHRHILLNKTNKLLKYYQSRQGKGCYKINSRLRYETVGMPRDRPSCACPVFSRIDATLTQLNKVCISFAPCILYEILASPLIVKQNLSISVYLRPTAGAVPPLRARAWVIPVRVRINTYI